MAKVERGMSVETQDSPLVSLILSDTSSPTSKHLDAHSLSAHDYLLSLTSHSLVDLRSQPAALSTAKASLNTQLSSLCSQHVSSFAQVHHATSSLPSSLNSLDSALQSLIERDLPALSNVAQQFSQQIEGSLQAKEKAQNIISQYDLMLKDLLDIPRLLMTCVRANHPVEALQLAVHMMKIVAHSKYNNVYKALQEECWTHLKRLREDLLRGLGARGLRLPAAKRLVSLLRKFKEIDEAGRGKADIMDEKPVEKLSLSDGIICLSFLRSRWTLIEELMSNASATRSTSILSLHLSTWRDVVGDTCGVAQALFVSNIIDDQDELSPDTLVFLFSHQALSALQRLLSEAIPGLREEATSLQENFDTLAAIHTQLAYSAASLARQGLEISATVSGQDIFHLEVIALWTKALNGSKLTFERSRLGRDASDCLSWISRDGLQNILSQELRSFSEPEEWILRAKQFPDVTLFINSLLKCYNALLSFAPHTTGRQVLSALDSLLYQTFASLLADMERNERVELNLSLPLILSSNQQSRYFENDMARQSEANMAILARVLMVLCKGTSSHVRGLILEMYQIDSKEDAKLSEIKVKARDWAQQAEDAWMKGEQTRQERVRVEEEKLAAEEKRQREEEQARLAELERLRAEEAVRRQEEEKERERHRLVELKQAEEAEAVKRRVLEAEEARKREEEAAQERQRRVEEEAKEKQQQEEEARRAIIAEEEAQKAKEVEEEAQKAREAEEEARRIAEAEEEARRAREVEAQVEGRKAEEKVILQKKAEEEAEKQDVAVEGQQGEEAVETMQIEEKGEENGKEEDKAEETGPSVEEDGAEQIEKVVEAEIEVEQGKEAQAASAKLE